MSGDRGQGVTGDSVTGRAGGRTGRDWGQGVTGDSCLGHWEQQRGVTGVASLATGEGPRISGSSSSDQRISRSADQVGERGYPSGVSILHFHCSGRNQQGFPSWAAAPSPLVPVHSMHMGPGCRAWAQLTTKPREAPRHAEARRKHSSMEYKYIPIRVP